MAPSFPSERKRVLTPRTGLLTYAFTSHLPRNAPFRACLQWFSSTFVQTKVPRLVSWPALNDEVAGRGVHSCGAVAEFHRLPEHPGDSVVSCAAPRPVRQR
jgi:hypothetical protein